MSISNKEKNRKSYVILLFLILFLGSISFAIPPAEANHASVTPSSQTGPIGTTLQYAINFPSGVGFSNKIIRGASGCTPPGATLTIPDDTAQPGDTNPILADSTTPGVYTCSVKYDTTSPRGGLLENGARAFFTATFRDSVGDFNCYQPLESFLSPITPATLSDQFIENARTEVGGIFNVCTSSNKDVILPPELEDNDSTSPFGFEHHLTIRNLLSPIILEEPITVTIENQFGTFEGVVVRQATHLISPADKTELNVVGEPPFGLLDQHWLCYEINVPISTETVIVRTTDQFMTEQHLIGNLNFLCNPVVKQVGSEIFEPKNNRHLTCGFASAVPLTNLNKLFTDQFGATEIRDGFLRYVCMDTTKNPPSGCVSNVECADGNRCNGAEFCDLDTGLCQPGTPLNCNDNNACTDDSCNPASGCSNEPISCNDGVSCTVDSCNPATGCDNDPNDDLCGRSLLQCQAPICDPLDGCGLVNVPDDTSCSDNNACTKDEVCTGGACGGGTPTNCDDGNVCTTDSCDPKTGCASVPVTDGTIPDGAGSCDTGLQGVCAEGFEVCTGGALVCEQSTQASNEVCDELDNDCDGQVDEELGVTTCGLGVCENTVENCVGGVTLVCDPFAGASDEVCDELDNDCDGEVDEGGVCNAAPICEDVVPSQSSLWPPNHKNKSITINGVTDPDGDPITIIITSIFQDEPVNGLGDGDTSPDGDGVGTDTAEVKAERSGQGNGRVYHISFTADDGNGGLCSGTVQVGVPHDKKDTAVDDGANFDSTQP